LNESIRDEVRRLASWGPVPSEPAWDDVAADLDAFSQDAQRVPPPITTPERFLLLPLLDRPDEDSVYGILNHIVTLLESAPATGWQMELPTSERPWFDYLRVRWTNYLDKQHPRD
jgi:hypothetical protein